MNRNITRLTKPTAVALFFVLATSLTFGSDANAAGFDGCANMFPGGIKPSSDFSAYRPRELCFSGFAVLHSGLTKTPIFAVERLTRERLQDAADEARTDEFYEEARLPEGERARLSDYTGSGYDRGHMAPAADMPNQVTMAQSFSLANIVPQNSDNNRNAWADIERDTRKFVKRTGHEVYVFTGVAFTKNRRTIGASQVWVPDFLYKLVYDATDKRAWAYWEANTSAFQVSRPIGYGDLVQRLGYSLLPEGSVR